MPDSIAASVDDVHCPSGKAFKKRSSLPKCPDSIKAMPSPSRSDKNVRLIDVWSCGPCCSPSTCVSMPSATAAGISEHTGRSKLNLTAAAPEKRCESSVSVPISESTPWSAMPLLSKAIQCTHSPSQPISRVPSNALGSVAPVTIGVCFRQGAKPQGIFFYFLPAKWRGVLDQDRGEGQTT